MNKKGFSLIELLAVIVIIGIIGGIGVVSVTAINNNIKKNMLEKKIDVIEAAAKLYGDDNKNSVIKSLKKYNSNPCISIKVNKLIPDYLDSDTKDTCNGNCVVNPSNKDNYLDNKNIIIYYSNSKIHTKLDMDGKLKCKK